MFTLATLAALQLLSADGADGGFTPPETPGELRAQILAADSVLFDGIFNRCELDLAEAVTTADVTMIHDQGGMNEGREAFFVPVRENICSGSPVKPLRYPDIHTMEIFPLYENGVLYGAIQRGRHSFYLREGEDDDTPRLTNRARFFHLWALSETGWRLETAISFDHMNPSENHPLDMDVLLAGFDRSDDTGFMMQELGITGLSLAVIENGVLSEVRSFGRQAEGVPMRVDTIFNVASLTKPVTALVALRLAAEGRWDLDRPLADFHLDADIAGTQGAGRVTTRHVLSHTTGLPNWRYLGESRRLAFDFAPGTQYQYSGEGFEWLRQALEAATGESLEALAQTFVFAPAGMTDTSYLFPQTEVGRVAVRHDETGEPLRMEPHSRANGAANLTTTAADYARFMAWLMDGAGLPEPLSQSLFANQLPEDYGTAFGLGWSLMRDLPGGETGFVHTGSDPGVRALAVGLTGSRRGLVILSNSDNAMPAWSGIITEMWGETGEALVERARE
jgi:CubicO group peptidase (beta-lactamase class C family)